MPEKQTANRIIYAAVFLTLFFGQGCITAPPRKITLAEKAREENAVGEELADQFDSKLRYREDPSVDRYLARLAQRLAKPTGDPRLTETGVAVIQDRAGQWRTYSLPGKKIYISLGLLQQLQYDNEVAAVVALEFGNIIHGNALRHLKKQLPNAEVAVVDSDSRTAHPPAHVDFFGQDGLFSFDVEEMKHAIDSAISILYGAGFDVRGLSHVWSILEANPSRSPFPENVLNELAEHTRATISKYAPLRNPIVGTQEFQTIHKRILKL